MVLTYHQPQHTPVSIVEKNICWNHPYLCKWSSAPSVHAYLHVSDQDVITGLDNGTRENLKTIRNDAKCFVPDLSISYLTMLAFRDPNSNIDALVATFESCKELRVLDAAKFGAYYRGPTRVNWQIINILTVNPRILKVNSALG